MVIARHHFSAPQNLMMGDDVARNGEKTTRLWEYFSGKRVPLPPTDRSIFPKILEERERERERKKTDLLLTTTFPAHVCLSWAMVVVVVAPVPKSLPYRRGILRSM